MEFLAGKRSDGFLQKLGPDGVVGGGQENFQGQIVKQDVGPGRSGQASGGGAGGTEGDLHLEKAAAFSDGSLESSGKTGRKFLNGPGIALKALLFHDGVEIAGIVKGIERKADLRKELRNGSLQGAAVRRFRRPADAKEQKAPRLADVHMKFFQTLQDFRFRLPGGI